MTGQTETIRGAQVIFIPPPLYYVAGFAGGMLLESLVSLPIGGRPASTVAGAVVGVLGLMLCFAGVGAVIRHRTTIVPHRPVAALVTTGAYRWSRNPMYTGLAITYLGVALLVGSWWPIVLWPLVVLGVTRLVIEPEERHPAPRFGPPFSAHP